jgi:hypothetical protein
MRQEETFRRLSQSIVDAAGVADKDEVRKAAALVVNSVGTMVTPKTSGRTTQFDAAADFLGSAIQKARASKQSERKENKETEKTETPKTLAELLVEAQDNE